MSWKELHGGNGDKSIPNEMKKLFVNANARIGLGYEKNKWQIEGTLKVQSGLREVSPYLKRQIPISLGLKIGRRLR